MYVPEYFRIHDANEIRAFVTENLFATLVSVVDGAPFATHVPLVLDANDDHLLIGHIAHQNPQALAFSNPSPSLAIFHGAHAYVSPARYETAPNVPTWNYVAIHASGTIRPLTEPDDAIRALQILVNAMDPNLAATNPEAMDHEFWRKKLFGIVAFEFVVDVWNAKAKVSQNRPERDQRKVVQSFQESELAFERDMAQAMLRFGTPKTS